MPNDGVGPRQPERQRRFALAARHRGDPTAEDLRDERAGVQRQSESSSHERRHVPVETPGSRYQTINWTSKGVPRIRSTGGVRTRIAGSAAEHARQRDAGPDDAAADSATIERAMVMSVAWAITPSEVAKKVEAHVDRPSGRPARGGDRTRAPAATAPASARHRSG